MRFFKWELLEGCAGEERVCFVLRVAYGTWPWVLFQGLKQELEQQGGCRRSRARASGGDRGGGGCGRGPALLVELMGPPGLRRGGRWKRESKMLVLVKGAGLKYLVGVCAVYRGREDRPVLGGKYCKDRTGVHYVLFLNKILFI